MKSATDTLFQLIKRLTKSEKRYFKLFATRNTRGEKNNYLQLFEAIEKQQQYDEEALKKKFRDSRFIKYFSTAKTQLKHQILDALHEFHSNSTTEQIKKMIHQVMILIDKGFFEEARKLNQKVRQKIYDSKLYHLLPELLFYEKESFNRFYTLQPEVLDNLHQETRQINTLIEQQSLQWYTVLSLYLTYNKNVKLRQEEDQRKIMEVIQPVIDNKPDEDNTVAHIYYHRAMGRYYAMLGDLEKNFEHLEKALDLYHNNPALIETSMMLYINLYHNFLIPCHNLGKYELFLKGVADIESLNKTHKVSLLEAAHIFIYTSNARLLHYWRTRNFDSCLPVAREMEKGIVKYRELLAMHRILALYDTLVGTFMVLEMYDDALTWINMILDERKATVLQGFTSVARIKSILVHFEMGNFLLLENLLLSSKRYMQNRGRLFKAERILLSAFRKILNAPDRNEQVKHFTQLKSDLNQLKADPFEAKIFLYFEFEVWADSKIEGIPFRTALSRKS